MSGDLSQGSKNFEDKMHSLNDKVERAFDNSENQTSQNNKNGEDGGKNGIIGKRSSLESKSAILHTYRQDVQDLVKNRKISLVKAMAMQMDKNAKSGGGKRVVFEDYFSEDKDKKTAKFIILISILLLIMGGLALFVAYGIYQVRIQQVLQDKKNTLVDNNMFFVEHRARINVTDRLPREILSDLSRMLRRSQATLGSITQILPEWSVWSDETGNKITFTIDQAQLVKVLGLSLPDAFIRNLGEPDKYMLGMHMADRNTPFLLLTTRSYEYAFAGMLDWEKRAEYELSPFFNLGGSSSGKRVFEDLVVKNIDARAIRDEDRNLKLLYSFLDQNTILITNNIHTLIEVAERYKVRKASRDATVIAQ